MPKPVKRGQRFDFYTEFYDFKITGKDKVVIEKLYKEHNMYDLISRSFAKDVYGYDKIKKMLCCSLASANDINQQRKLERFNFYLFYSFNFNTSFMIFSFFLLLSAFFCLFLPETLNKSLPENTLQATLLNRSKN